MDNFNILNILCYCLFGTFLYYQQLHVTHFRGASRVFENILSISVLAGMIVGLVFLFFYGYKVIWWAPLIIFTIGILFTFVGVFFEKLVGTFWMSMLAFIVWPVCAYLMFKTIPTL